MAVTRKQINSRAGLTESEQYLEKKSMLLEFLQGPGICQPVRGDKITPSARLRCILKLALVGAYYSGSERLAKRAAT